MRSRWTFLIVAVCLLLPGASGAQRDVKTQDTIEAMFWKGEATLDGRPDKLMWKKARPIAFQHDWRGDLLVGNLTTVRSVWTTDALWLLFSCAYDSLTISPDPQAEKETDRLWAISDVAEVFIAANPGDLMRYKEFQVSPMGQWIDLHIDREASPKNHDAKWDSGFRSIARIDSGGQTWWAEIAIPLKAFGVAPPTPGTRWRLNFFRWEHGPPPRAMSWQPTYTPQPNFHVPQAFGWLAFKK